MEMLKKRVQRLLESEDIGIALNGDAAHDLQVHNEHLYDRVVLHGSLGLGEAYQDGWWDCSDLPEFFRRIMSSGIDRKFRMNAAQVTTSLMAKLINLQSAERAPGDIGKHYDLGNEFYASFLDSSMQYSCARWNEGVSSLEGAQQAKLELICRKLKLEPGMTVLDIGCGWGGLATFMARACEARVVGITLSKEQAKLARERCEGLPVEILEMDYRDLPMLSRTFDRIVSVGMFEHVGPKNYRGFMRVAQGLLKESGLFLLHTIGGEGTMEPWLARYIFPGGCLPRQTQISLASEDMFVMEDWENFGAHYALTLAAWRERFISAWPSIQAQDPVKYDDRFFRTFIYYFSCCEGSFAARRIQLWQIVLAKGGVPGGYRSVR